MRNGVRAIAWLLALVFGVAARVDAMPGAYSDAAAFAAAVPGGIAQVDFESLPDGAPLSGTTQTAPSAATGIILPGPVADVLDPGGAPRSLRVVQDGGDNPASSGTRSLGVDDAKNFDAVTAGTPLAFGFTAPVDAFGLTLVTPEEPGGALFDADVQLLVPGEATASLSLAQGQLLGTFGGREYRAYFVGVVGAAPFTSATLDFGGTTPTSGFFFNVDDLAVPLPEPGSGALWAGGALAFALHLRKGRRR